MMDKVIYVLLVVFVGYNVVLAVALLAKACRDIYGARRPPFKVGKAASDAVKTRRGVWTGAAWRDRRAVDPMRV